MVGEHESLDELKAAFRRELPVDKRAAAETAYALAFRFRNADVDGCRRFDLAKEWAECAIELLDTLPSDSLAAVASRRAFVGGVSIPELLHAAVARERLGDVLM